MCTSKTTAPPLLSKSLQFEKVKSLNLIVDISSESYSVLRLIAFTIPLTSHKIPNTIYDFPHCTESEPETQVS